MASPPPGTVVVAPDKFKGTLSAPTVAAALAEGFAAIGVEAVMLPVADGGDGTAATLAAAGSGELVATSAHDALGRPVEAELALLDDGKTAVVDVAAASGLWRLAEQERDAWRATSAGTGELIAAAIARGAETVIVAAGGSATSDGGAGAIEALGPGPLPARLLVACDVRTTWEEAAPVFGPQKGMEPSNLPRLQARMDALAARLPRDPRGRPLTGCAGGLSGALWSQYGAELVPGGDLVLDALGFDARLAGAALVVTGEGRIDDQTLHGKAVAAVAARCRRAGVPCAAVVGRNELTPAAQQALGLWRVLEAGDEEALRAAAGALWPPPSS